MKFSSGPILLFLLLNHMVEAQEEEDYEEEEDYSGDYSDEDYSGEEEEEGDSGDYDYQYDYEREEGEGNSGDYYEYETKYRLIKANFPTHDFTVRRYFLPFRVQSRAFIPLLIPMSHCLIIIILKQPIPFWKKIFKVNPGLIV